MSEFFAGELALVLNRGRGTARHLHHRALAWRENLPATYTALSAGDLDLARAAALADVLGTTRPELARAVEALLLPEAGDLSVARLRARALELLLELDAAAAEARREQAKPARRRVRAARCRRHGHPRRGPARPTRPRRPTR